MKHKTTTIDISFLECLSSGRRLILRTQASGLFAWYVYVPGYSIIIMVPIRNLRLYCTVAGDIGYSAYVYLNQMQTMFPGP